MASSNNPGIYFRGSMLYFNYDEAIFGTTLSGTTITPGSYFNVPGSDYGIYPAICCDTMLSVSFHSSPFPGYATKVALGASPVLMLHFQLEVLYPPSGGIPPIRFLVDHYEDGYAQYVLSSNAYYYDFYHYNYTYLFSSPAGEPPHIAGFSPATAVAGVGSILTINGSNFGHNQGTVYFTAADRGGIVNNNVDFLKDLDDQYIESWNNTQIRVMVPSIVYKGYENEPVNKWSGGAGTGTIKIKTASGDSCASQVALQIPYSVLNQRAASGGVFHIYRAHFARQHCDYDFRFTMHADYQNDAAKIAVIDTALRHWSELTGLTLRLERDANGNPVFAAALSNDKNIIYPMLSSESGYFMLVENKFETKMINGEPVMYRTAGSHIGINNQPVLNGVTCSWNYSISGSMGNNEVSFYQAFMHELGHILMLGHVNAPSQLMYYNVRALFPNILNINASSPDVYAALQNIEASRAINWPLWTGILPPGVKNPKITISPSGHPPVLCEGETITLSSNYSTGNLWSTGAVTQSIQVSAAGTYILYNTESMWCTRADTVVIASSSSDAYFLVIPVECHGENTGYIITNVTGTHPPFTYQWTGSNGFSSTSPNIYNLAAGTYYLSLSNSAGCTANYSVTVSEPDKLKASIGLSKAVAPISLVFFVARVSGGTPPYSYEWSQVSQGGFSDCSAIPANYIHASSIPVNYSTPSCPLKLTVTDACGEQTEAYPAKNVPAEIQTVDVKEHDLNYELSVYPNPAQSEMTVALNSPAVKIVQMEIYDVTGRKVYQQAASQSYSMLKLNGLAQGIYILKVQLDNEDMVVKKIVKQ